jgi:hypothetical protein
MLTFAFTSVVMPLNSSCTPCPAVPSKTRRPIFSRVEMVMVLAVATVRRSVTWTSLTTKGDGGTKKSLPVVTVPPGVVSVR